MSRELTVSINVSGWDEKEQKKLDDMTDQEIVEYLFDGQNWDILDSVFAIDEH